MRFVVFFRGLVHYNNKNNNNKSFIWHLLQTASERQIQDHVKKNNNIYIRGKNNNIIPSKYNLNNEHEQKIMAK